MRADSQFCVGIIGILCLQTHVSEQKFSNIANSETAEVSAAKLWSVADFSSSSHNESWSGATAGPIEPQHTQTASSCHMTVQIVLPQ